MPASLARPLAFDPVTGMLEQTGERTSRSCEKGREGFSLGPSASSLIGAGRDSIPGVSRLWLEPFQSMEAANQFPTKRS